MTTPLAHSIPEACTATRVSRTLLYEAIRAGTLRAVKNGRRTLILDEDLRTWIKSLPTFVMKAAAGGDGDAR
ncbi:helix-turn-helix domain-containing protein [Bradyrhizobium oropedii]|uniref:helix-turn-helix domain-containing protein n=1 Tax=Bradyrhizobium oropedii TaxID=1571201 RepID=UPI003B849036